MIVVIQPSKEMVIVPFEVGHTDVELGELSKLLRELDGKTRIVIGELLYASYQFPLRFRVLRFCSERYADTWLA